MCTVAWPHWQQEPAQDERNRHFTARSCLVCLERWGRRPLHAGRSAADHAAAVRGQPGAVCGHVRRLQARHPLRQPLLIQRQHLPVDPCVQGITRVSELRLQPTETEIACKKTRISELHLQLTETDLGVQEHTRQ